ncbi:MAG: hypothetical protein OHK0017_01690 [Patescibacteria group bacterium]
MSIEILTQLNPGQKIAIIGLGKENIQFLEWLIKVVKLDSEKLILLDSKDLNQEAKEVLDELNFNGEIKTGEDYLEHLSRDEIEIVFKAPGIWSLKPEFISFRQKKGEDRVVSSLCFFMHKFRNQIIGVTGTKGKSTTSSLINYLINNLDKPNPSRPTYAASLQLQEQRVRSYYCGNTTGISPYQFWTSLEQKIDPSIYFVVELSSFQLQDLGYSKISPKFAVITNYFIDHLDQHSTKEEYWAAKDNLFRFQKPEDVLIYSPIILNKTSLGSRLEQQFLIDTDKINEITSGMRLPLIGEHNRANTAQACIMVEAVRSGKAYAWMSLRQNLAKYSDTLKSFSGLPHRLEFVRGLNERIFLEGQEFPFRINFYDDGAATEPDAVMAAVNGLTQNKNQYLWLFVTGVDKGPDVTDLARLIFQKEISNSLYRANYCGKIGQRLLSEIYAQMGSRMQEPVENFHEAVENSFKSVENLRQNFERWLNNKIEDYRDLGQNLEINKLLNQSEFILNIVLSPCGSSFDEFPNYIVRSEWWVEHINNLK